MIKLFVDHDELLDDLQNGYFLECFSNIFVKIHMILVQIKEKYF